MAQMKQIIGIQWRNVIRYDKSDVPSWFYCHINIKQNSIIETVNAVYLIKLWSSGCQLASSMIPVILIALICFRIDPKRCMFVVAYVHDVKNRRLYISICKYNGRIDCSTSRLLKRR